MIDAKTALNLVIESDEMLDKYLEDLSMVIEREARLGKRFVFPASAIALKYRALYEVEHEPFYPSEMTGVQKRIKANLEKLGFSVKLEKKEVQIGGGLGSMDDEVRHEMHDYIKISW